MSALRKWPEHEMLHAKRDWNKSADHLATLAMRDQVGVTVSDPGLLSDLTEINRLPELIHPANTEEVIRVNAVTWPQKRRSSAAGSTPLEAMNEGVVQQLRAERIRQAQNEEEWIVDLKAYLKGEVDKLTAEKAKECFKLAPDYEVDENGLLIFYRDADQQEIERDKSARLVVSTTLQPDILHHYHVSLEGGHQGIGRTYHNIRAHFHWRGLYPSVQAYVGSCPDCETGKGRPTIKGRSPGNIQATYPF